MKDLPIYLLELNLENEGVSYVALVDRPAIRQDWIAMCDESPFQFVDEEKRIIFGPLMVPDMPIYRKIDSLGEHMVMFTADTIKQVAQKFFKNKNNANVNLMHDPAKKIEGCFDTQSFISGDYTGAVKGFEKLPMNTWFAEYKVENDEVWASVKDGTFKGFSVEGLFSYSETPMEAEVAEFLELIKKTPSSKLYLLSELTNMESVKELLAKAKLLFSEKIKLMEVKTKDGIAITIDGEIPALQAAVRIGDAVAPDGDYALEDGTILKVLAGVISEIVPKDAVEGEPVDEMKKLLASIDTRIKSLEDKNTALETAKLLTEVQFSEQKKANETLTEKNTTLEATIQRFKEQIEATLKIVEAIANSEAAPEDSTSLQFKKREDKFERLNKISEIKSKL